MSVLEKAEKALEFLKNSENSTKSYELQTATGTLGRCLGALGSRPHYTRHYANLLPSAIPTLLSLASNNSAEVRLVGDEALNRAVVGGHAFHACKTNIVLQSQIDPTKSPRWIRAAMQRICLGDCWLRPGVGKVRSQAQTLFPKLTQIVKTASDTQLIMETMENNLPRILSALAEYTTDEEILDLAQALFQHVQSNEPPVRRGTVVCLAHLCKHREILVPKILNVVFEKLWPQSSEPNIILGWFGAVKSIFQLTLFSTLAESDLFTVQDFLELYQLCIHYIELRNVDHNTHNAVMECLTVLISNASGEFKKALLERHPSSITLGSRKREELHRRPASSVSGVASVFSSVPQSLGQLMDDLSSNDISDQLKFSGALHLGSLSQLQSPHHSLEDLTIQTPDSPASDVHVDLSASEQLSKHLVAKLEEIEAEEVRSDGPEEQKHNDKVITINIGGVSDDDIPLKYCTRLLASRFILGGAKGTVIPDRSVRVSVKASALSCMSAILQHYPQALTLFLDKDVDLTSHNYSGASEGTESNQDNINEFILERNVCFQESISDSFCHDLLNMNKSMDSQNQAMTNSASITSKREQLKSTVDSLEQKSSTKDVASNILDSKNVTKNDLMTSIQSADSTNPNMTNSNFTSNSNMTTSNDRASTDLYPFTSSGDFLTPSLDLEMKFDHFGESTTNVDSFDAQLRKPQLERHKSSSEDKPIEKDVHIKKPLVRTHVVDSRDVPDCRTVEVVRVENETEKDIEETSNKEDDVVKAHPQVSEEKIDFENQHISDMFILLENHGDPQIRGLARMCIGSYLNSALDLSHGDYTRWKYFSSLPKEISEKIAADNLVDIVLKGLSDEIHSCVNHTLMTLGKIFKTLAVSSHSSLLPKILNSMIEVESNSYWLCKVNLCKFYEKLPYERLSMVCPGYISRSTLIVEVLFRLLSDQDQKVRAAAACAISEIATKIQPSRRGCNGTLTKLAKEQTKYFDFDHEGLALDLVKKSYFHSDLPEQLKEGVVGDKCDNLTVVIMQFVSNLMESSCKFYSQGLLEGLHAMCKRWQPWQYMDSYTDQGLLELCLDHLDYCNGSVALRTLMLDLCTQLYPVDIWKAITEKTSQTKNDIFERDSPGSKEKWQHLENERCSNLAEKFLQITLKMLNILVHLIEEINPNVHLHKTGIALPGSPVRRKTQDTMPRRSSNSSEASEEKGSLRKKPGLVGGNARANFVGQFVNDPFYMKLYDNLRAAYSNHKINLDPKSSMFNVFMSTVLDALSIQLELGTEKEFGLVTEEILHYLRVILPLRADKAVFCVTQLLKCLFGTNMANQYTDYMSFIADDDDNITADVRVSFFEDILMVNALKGEPEEGFECRRGSVSSNVSRRISVESKNPKMSMEKQLLIKMENFARNKSDRKWSTNKKELERYIRLFEPVVIQALKSYTMQNDIPLQCKVLSLLNQLLMLRVNYCMLDSDQIFIGFLLKQLDLVEQHEIPNCCELVNSIMLFLVQLSSSKHHTKQLMEIPKLIQLCDGLMASGSHAECIRALEPVVVRVFWSAGTSNPGLGRSQLQETQVTREVLFYMLQKTMHDPKVLDLVSCVLALSQEHPESYYRWSELATDTLLNLLSQRSLELDSRESVASLERLFDSVYKDVLLEQSRVEMVLKILFKAPPDQVTASYKMRERYLATTMVLLRKVLVNMPETEILLTINYLKASFISPLSIFFNVKTEIDPLNVQNVNENCANLSPDVILVRFLFKTLTYTIGEIDKCTDAECVDFDRTDEGNENHRLLYAVTLNLICHVKHMLHLTNGCLFPLTAKTAQSILHNEQSGLNTGLYSPEENIPLEKLNLICVQSAFKIPLLTVHWSHLLIRLKFLEQKYWQNLLGYVRSSPLSPENGGKPLMQTSVLHIGCFMAYCEYFVENGLTEAIHLTWLIVNRIHILVSFYNEPIVRRLVAKLHQSASASGLLLQAVAARCQSCLKNEFALNTYEMLSDCHESQSGSLVFLICRIMGKLELAIAYRFADLAVKRCRQLKALPQEQINVQLSKEDLQVALELLQRDKVHIRYSALVLELNALATSVFDLSPLDLSQERTINPRYVITTKVDETWLVNQVKNRCCQNSTGFVPKIEKLIDLALLLSALKKDELTTVFACSEFDRRILHSCFKVACDIYLKEFLKNLATYESKEIEKQNAKQRREIVKVKDDMGVSVIDSNILNVANSLMFKRSESKESKSQFFISIAENKDGSNKQEKFGNLQISDEEPNELIVPELPILYTESIEHLDKSLANIIRQFPKQNRPLSQSENFNLTSDQTVDRYTRRCHQVFQDKLFYYEFCIVQNVLSGFLDSQHRLEAFSDKLDCDIAEKIIQSTLPPATAKNISTFTVISMQYLSFLIKNKKIVECSVHSDVSFRVNAGIDKVVVDNVIGVTLETASKAFGFKRIWNELNVESNVNRIQSAIGCLYAVTKHCVKDTKPLILKQYLRPRDGTPVSDIALTCDKLLTLIEYLEVNFYSTRLSPSNNILSGYYRRSIELLLVGLSRLDLVSNVALIPPLAWSSVDLSTKLDNMQKIEIPLQALQDMDILEAFLFRVNLIGWSTKKVFEEIWVSLLGALQGNGTHWAVRGIMQLLLSTIPSVRRDGRPDSVKLHCPRKYQDDSNGIQRMRNIVVGTTVYGKLFEDINFERIPFLNNEDSFNYHYGQFNIEFLRLASEITDDASFRVKTQLQRMKASTEVDVNSCLQLLMDVATQMLQPKASTGLSARCSLLSCVINVSDLFTEIGQWCWLAQQLITLTGAEYKLVMQYSVASQYLLYGLSKALSTLEGFEGLGELSSVYQKLLKSLGSSYAPLRQAALHGCLLQLCGRAQHAQNLQGSPNPYQELVTQLTLMVRQYLSPQYRISLYEQSLYWTVLFTLVELGHSDLINTAVDFLLTTPNHFCGDLVVKGITSMLRIGVLPKELKNSMMEKLLDKMGSYSETHGIQILMVHLFSADDKLLSPRLTTDVSNMDPDVLMTSMERITLLYKVLRESSQSESKSVSATALKYFLRETLPPAATLSRVVIEFLEFCREAERHDSGVLTDKSRWILSSVLSAEVVFEVFQTAVSQDQLSVLSGWIFEALCHLLSGKISDRLLPYCLLVLLISASGDNSLRQLSPLTFHTLRLGFSPSSERWLNDSTDEGGMSFVDRRLLCIAAVHSGFGPAQLKKLQELCGDKECFQDLLRCVLSA